MKTPTNLFLFCFFISLQLYILISYMTILRMIMHGMILILTLVTYDCQIVSVPSSGPTNAPLPTNLPSFSPTSIPTQPSMTPTFYPFHDDAFKLISKPPTHPTHVPTYAPNMIASNTGSINSNQLLLLLLLLPVIGAAIFCWSFSDVLERSGFCKLCCMSKDRILDEP